MSIVVKIARLGRDEGFNAFARTGGAPPVDAVASAWLSGHVHRLPSAVEQRLYLWSFRTGWMLAQRTATKGD